MQRTQMLSATLLAVITLCICFNGVAAQTHTRTATQAQQVTTNAPNTSAPTTSAPTQQPPVYHTRTATQAQQVTTNAPNTSAPTTSAPTQQPPVYHTRTATQAQQLTTNVPNTDAPLAEPFTNGTISVNGSAATWTALLANASARDELNETLTGQIAVFAGVEPSQVTITNFRIASLHVEFEIKGKSAVAELSSAEASEALCGTITTQYATGMENDASREEVSCRKIVMQESGKTAVESYDADAPSQAPVESSSSTAGVIVGVAVGVAVLVAVAAFFVLRQRKGGAEEEDFEEDRGSVVTDNTSVTTNPVGPVFVNPSERRVLYAVNNGDADVVGVASTRPVTPKSANSEAEELEMTAVVTSTMTTDDFSMNANSQSDPAISTAVEMDSVFDAPPALPVVPLASTAPSLMVDAPPTRGVVSTTSGSYGVLRPIGPHHSPPSSNPLGFPELDL